MVLYSYFFSDGLSMSTSREITYQELCVPLVPCLDFLPSAPRLTRSLAMLSSSRTSLLARGLVQKVTIVNHTRAQVTLVPSGQPSSSMSNAAYDSPSPPPFSSSSPTNLPAAASYFFTIGSPDAFERQLQEAQDELGIPSHERIPVQYTSATSWGDTAISFLPTALLVGLMVWSIRRMNPGGAGGGGGPGGVFGVGKSKAKMFKLVDGSLASDERRALMLRD